MIQDIRYGLKMLARQPALTAVAVVTLALGIGANTVIFSGVHTLLFQALPYPNGDRLVVVSQVTKQGTETGVSYPDFEAWREHNSVFEHVTASRPIKVNMSEPGSSGEVEVVTGSYVSRDLFSLLDGRPSIGRVFDPEESGLEKEKVIIISDRLWQRRFGANRNVIGKQLLVNESLYTVVGIMPPAFQYPFGANFWIPLNSGESAETLVDAWANVYQVLALRKPGITAERAINELTSLERPSNDLSREQNTEAAVRVTDLRETITGIGRYRTPVLALQLAVVFVLLIGSANLANVLLARNTHRRQEFSVRLALGARPARLFRQLLTESLLLGMFGTIFGMVLGWWGLNALRSIIPWRVAGVAEVEINTTVLLVTLLISLLTTLAFGVGPAVLASRQDLIEPLKSAAASTTIRARRLSGSLVVTEVALAVMLLVASVLMIRTFLNLTDEDPGFNPDDSLALSLTLPGPTYPDYSSLATFFGDAIAGIKAIPGVEAVGGVTYLPLIGYNPGTDFAIEGRTPISAETNLRADLQPITPEYLRAMDIPLIRGRAFNDTDMRTTPESVLINQAMAAKFWPGKDPLGEQIQLLNQKVPGGSLAIVGIIGDVKQFGLHSEARPEIYMPMYRSSMTLIVRTSASPVSLIDRIREAVQRLDERAAFNVRPMTQVVADSIEKRKVFALLLSTLGAVALAMAALGIYGVISYMVSQRTREIGVRVALGASRQDVVGLVLARGLKLTGLGILSGLAGSYIVTRLLQRLLFGVGAGDPITLVMIAVLLGATSIVACLLPARRAAKVDPQIALREQ